MPLLKELEEEYKQLLVIGVHSAKFPNEKSKKNIDYAVRKHLLKHPIVCDNELDLWTSLEINCWPTFMILNPFGEIIAEFQGELQANLVNKFLKYCFEYYGTELTVNGFEFINMKTQQESTSTTKNEELCFPTKLCLDDTNKFLFISDSGNNRIIAVDSLTLNHLYSIGGQIVAGYQDGKFNEAKFNWPQGLAFDSDFQCLYVADTENNLIRCVDIKEQVVSTLCGVYNNGKKNIGNYDYIGGKIGLEQTISSPWDICLHKRDDKRKFLIIACAGTHQIWLYTFKDVNNETNFLWWKNVTVSVDSLICIAGNGKERNRNNSYPLQASFAQPSGLDIKNDVLFIADAESSTIRMLSLKDGSVKNVVGGDSSQPDNLFAFGDIDGIGAQVRLQHPMDAKCLNENDILIADAYNNKIKIIDVKSKSCKSLGNLNKLYSEPNGLCIEKSNERIYIADTNNHSIRVLNRITFDEISSRFKSEKPMNNSNFNKLVIKFDSSIHINHDAPNSWSIESYSSSDNIDSK
jgi:DNA-binding beta-propeller fold protein YncE